MPDLAQATSSAVSPSFEHEVHQAIEHLRVALADVVAKAPAPVKRPAELSRIFAIDKSLAWKLMRSIQADDPFAAAQLLPGPSGIEIFLAAAASHKVPDSCVQHATMCLEKYEAFIRQHAGDRGTFLRILGSLARDDAAATSIEAAHRKAAFEANSFLWGVKARTHLSVVIVRPNEDGDHVDIAIIVALIDLVRLRRDTPWVISRTAYVSDKGVIQPAVAREPIDPSSSDHDAPLMPAFCSQPLPSIIRRPVPGNFLETTLASGPIGETAATTITTGELFRTVAPRYRDEHNEDAKFYMRLRTPAEHMVKLTLVQRGEFAQHMPRFGMYSELDSVLHHPVNMDELKPLTTDATITKLGQADGPIVWPRESPRIGELLNHTCEHLGWSLGDFDVYQARQQHPILRSVAITAFPMLPRPASTSH